MGGFEALIWVIGFIIYIAYRAYRAHVLVQRKRAASQERRAEIEVAHKKRRGEFVPEDTAPKQELPWDFDPDDYKEKEVRSYRIEVKQVPKEEENVYQKKLKVIEDEQRSRSNREAGNVAINEKREPAPVGFSIKLDNQSLVNAVIMSEVLQPPRSKRPIRI